MTPKRAAAYLVLASLLIAWLASAAGVSRAPADPQPEPQPVRTAGTETLASDLQAQTIRLKDRLAGAPAPQDPSRNPFIFAPRKPALVRQSAARVDAPAAPSVASPAALEPDLSLIGIAEDLTPKGLVRAAILTAAGDELFMLKIGEVLAGRYKVSAIGPDVVELTDLATGHARRLTLR